MTPQPLTPLRQEHQSVDSALGSWIYSEGIRLLGTIQMRVEPRLGGFPVAIDGFRGNVEGGRRFLNSHATEVAHLHHPASPQVQLRQFRQSIVKGDKFGGARGRK